MASRVLVRAIGEGGKSIQIGQMAKKRNVKYGEDSELRLISGLADRKRKKEVR